MNLVRKYKLHKFFDEPLEEKELEIIKLIKNNLLDLSIYNNIEAPNTFYYKSIFYYHKEKGIMFAEHHGYNNLYIALNALREILKREYLMGRDDIKNILRYMIGEKFKHLYKKPIIFFVPSEEQNEIIKKLEMINTID